MPGGVYREISFIMEILNREKYDLQAERKTKPRGKKWAREIASAQRVLRCPLFTISFHSIGLTAPLIR